MSTRHIINSESMFEHGIWSCELLDIEHREVEFCSGGTEKRRGHLRLLYETLEERPQKHGLGADSF